jgi:osmotically-inducible protein OsmY
MSEDANRLFPRLILAVLIGWAWTAHGQKLSADGDRQSQVARHEVSSSTRDLANHVRGAIARDKSFSGYAHKVIVIPSVHGTVTLKGRVRSKEEKHAVEAKAAQVAGADNVNTELFVTSNAEADRSK